MSPALREIQTLDPERHYHRITLLSMRQDFPTDSTRALELALFRTYCSPRISALLDRTGQFRHHPQKRYDDTDIIISTLIEHGYDSDPGRRALRRMNQIHARFPHIPNEDFLYVLSTFILEPLRWNTNYGWRPLTPNERLAYFHFFRNVGTRMGIRDIPQTLDAFESFSTTYESRHFQYSPSNHHVGTATRDMMCRWFPRPLHPLVRRGLYAALAELHPRLLPSFGFPPSTLPERLLLRLIMSLRALTLRHLCPRRHTPYLRTTLTPRSYPQGYALENLGPDARQPTPD